MKRMDDENLVVKYTILMGRQPCHYLSKLSKSGIADRISKSIIEHWTREATVNERDDKGMDLSLRE
jgi:hypothetical protein